MAVEKTKISARTRPTVAQAIYQCVAETTVTTMMAQNFHWNVGDIWATTRAISGNL